MAKGIVQTKNGMFYFITKVKDSNGNFKSVRSPKYSTLKECEKAKKRLLLGDVTAEEFLASKREEITDNDVKNDDVSDSNCVTLEDICNGFINSQANILRRNTMLNLISIVNRHIYSVFDKSMPFKSCVKEESINKFLKYIKDVEGKNSIRNIIIRTFKQLCERAFYLGIITQLELGYINLNVKSLRKDSRSKNDFYTREEFDQFISVVDNIRYRMLFKMLFFGGFRIGELLGVQCKDVHDGRVDIYKIKDGGYVQMSTKNLRGKRSNLLPSMIYDELKNYIDECNFLPDDYIFDLSKPAVFQMNKLYAERAGIKKIRVHDFRHSCTCLLIQTYINNNQSINFNYIADYLGDTPNMILTVYSHSFETSSNAILDLI